MKERLLREFAERFGNAEGAQVYFAPGRVNLIGEHTDYNGGHVFPCALDIGTYAVVRKRQDKRLFFYSMNYPEVGIINWCDGSVCCGHGQSASGDISEYREFVLSLCTGTASEYAADHFMHE